MGSSGIIVCLAISFIVCIFVFLKRRQKDVLNTTETDLKSEVLPVPERVLSASIEAEGVEMEMATTTEGNGADENDKFIKKQKHKQIDDEDMYAPATNDEDDMKEE